MPVAVEVLVTAAQVSVRVEQAVVVMHQPRQAQTEPQTPEAGVVAPVLRTLPATAAAVSLLFARSSVALLRVSQRVVARKLLTRVMEQTVLRVRHTRFTRLLLLHR